MNSLRSVVMVQDEMQGVGYHEAVFRAEDFAPGVYFYELRVGDFQAIRRMVVGR